jgi:hypothetical protein
MPDLCLAILSVSGMWRSFYILLLRSQAIKQVEISLSGLRMSTFHAVPLKIGPACVSKLAEPKNLYSRFGSLQNSVDPQKATFGSPILDLISYQTKGFNTNTYNN